MTLKLPYIQPRGKGFRYRRAIPLSLRESLGKNEIILPAGRNEQEVLANYSSVHNKAEALLNEPQTLSEPEIKHGANETDLEAFRNTIHLLKERGIYSPEDLRSYDTEIDPRTDEEFDCTVSPFWNEADQLAEQHNGIPASRIPKETLLYIQALYGEFPTPPTNITLSDAKKVYLESKEQEGNLTFPQIRNDTNRIIGLAEEFFGKQTILSELRRTAAWGFVRSLQETHTNSTVERRLNTLRAVLNHAITELELNIPNPFNRITVENDNTIARDKRQSFTQEELTLLWKRINCHASDDLKRIWLILWGTGCRCSEVSGIGLSDVKIDHEIPHLDIAPNEVRGVGKSRSSRRLIPLVGRAYDAVKEAIDALPDDAQYLFPKYATLRGADGVSSALMRHVRQVTKEVTKVVYSLRHNAKDAMIYAEINNHVQELIFGRESGGIGETYGTDHARLKTMKDALEKADLFNALQIEQ